MTTGILDHFYEHLQEVDWLDGVDLYQAGKISHVQTFAQLITARINMGRKPFEVRIKLHPSGQCIQWVECTCRKNRKGGGYCEHIASVAILIDREKPELFAKLDAKMPLKHPGIKPKKVEKKKEKVETQINPGAAETLLNHLQGSIHSVSLIGKGPAVRVKIEIKAGKKTHYDLPLDQAAKFLDSLENKSIVHENIKKLKIFDESFELGTKIRQDDNEKVYIEKVIVQHVARKPRHIPAKAAYDKFQRITVQDQITSFDKYLVFPMSSVSTYLGSEYFFIPEQGYFPLDRSHVKADWYDLPLSRTMKEDDAVDFIKTNFGEYLNLGPVFLDQSLKDVVIVENPTLASIDVLEEKRGWFELDPKYGDGTTHVSMSKLVQILKKKKRKYIKAGSNWIRIPDFVSQFEWQLSKDGENLQVDTTGLMRLKAAIGDYDQFVGSKTLINKIRSKTEFRPVGNAPKLNHTNLDLREYQKIGAQWFWWLYNNNLHGLLADEMGLGKTHQAMALLSYIQQENKNEKFLVVCPTTVLDHWYDKMATYAPNLRTQIYHGPKRLHHLDGLGKDFDVLLTSYGILLRDAKHLSKIQWGAVVLDEAHFFKNSNTATYSAVCRLESRIRICLSGTPIENHLGELKSIFDFLLPGYLGSDEFFRKQFILPITQDKTEQSELALQKLIHPFKLRRTKENVLSDLPAKVEDIRHCTLSDDAVKLYKDVISIKASPLVQQLRDDNSPIPYLHVFAIITLLKQICNHPALLTGANEYHKYTSGKFELFKEIIDEAIGSNLKVVVYSQYVAMVEIFSRYLSDVGVGHVTLTGKTKNRGKVIEQFQTSPDCKVFCGSLLAGGIGIDLTAASVVVHYDRWWNASKEDQATDRVHRIGQNKNVQVLKLVTRGTLEERIDQMIKEKRNLSKKFLDKDEEIFRSLSRQELIELLQ